VTTQTVAYEERVIGYIPEPTRLESISDLGSLNRTVPVTAKFPILNEQGRPALSEEVVTFEGKGTPMIYVEQKEIVIPKLASDDVKLVSPHSSSNYARFYLETILQGTGYYGFYPDFADTSKKPDNGQKECLCQREENTVPSSNMVLLNKPGSPVLAVLRLLKNWALPQIC
jgi:hypothetical protein